MPAPDLKPQVPGAVAEPTQPAADTPLQALIKQTVVLIAEALPGLTARDLVELRDLETAGDNRKGVLQAIEAEDQRREEAAQAGEELSDTVLELMQSDENAVLLAVADRIVGNASPDEDARLEVAYAIARYLGLGWPSAELAAPPVYAQDPAEQVTNPIAAAGQAVLTDQGWVVPEPPKKG